MSNNLHASELGDIVEDVLLAADGEMIVAYPGKSLIQALVQVLDEHPESPIRILIHEETQKEAFGNFVITVKAADVVNDGVEIRTVEETGQAVILGDGHVVAPIAVEEMAAGLSDSDEGFVDAVDTELKSMWGDAEEYAIDAPGLETLAEELESQTTSELSAAFAKAVESAASIGETGDPIDAVTLALLLGARHEAQLYDLSEWGEQTGLASKATFSRKKTQLEEQAVIQTESEPIEVGRPRLRLHLSAEELETATPADFVDEARALLKS